MRHQPTTRIKAVLPAVERTCRSQPLEKLPSQLQLSLSQSTKNMSQRTIELLPPGKKLEKYREITINAVERLTKLKKSEKKIEKCKGEKNQTNLLYRFGASVWIDLNLTCHQLASTPVSKSPTHTQSFVLKAYMQAKSRSTDGSDLTKRLLLRHAFSPK